MPSNKIIYSFLNFISGLSLVLVFALPGPAEAQFVLPDSKCIRSAKGKKVRWDRSWQDDRRDHDAIYIIERITNKQSPLAIELRLVALDSAIVQTRIATITRGYIAKLFCERLVAPPKHHVQVAHGGGLRTLKKQEEIPEGFSSREVIAEDLVFRHWNGSSWVAAKPAPGTSPMVCVLPHRVYACSKVDFQILEESKRTKSQLNVTPYYKTLLPREFIRYTADEGWVRQVPLGLAIDSIFSTCTVAGVDYSCLTEEKKKYFQELRQLQNIAEFYDSYSKKK